MVVSWPQRVEHDPEPREQLHHVVDVAATIYDVLGIEPTARFNGLEQYDLDGISMAASFRDREAPTGQHTPPGAYAGGADRR